MARLDFRLATDADDAALRRLLRESPMPGAIAVSLEREPCYFRGAAAEGPVHQTLVAREAATGEVVGMASRSVRLRYVNGVPRPVGYMAGLRASPRHSWGLALARCLAQGFAFYRRLHGDGLAPFYLMSIVLGNGPARRLLEAGLPGFPRLRPYARFYTYAIAPRRRPRPAALPGHLRLARGRAEHAGALLECLQRNGARRQFYPCWTAGDLFSPDRTPDLRPEDFTLVLDGGRVAGCLAAWDQRGFKQAVVRRYAGPLARGRRLINLAARLGGWPGLPPPHTPIRQCFASHLAVDEDDPAIFRALLGALADHARARGDLNVLLGLGEADPLRAALAGWRKITYPSQLYLVAWEEGDFPALDGRPAGPELALL